MANLMQEDKKNQFDIYESKKNSLRSLGASTESPKAASNKKNPTPVASPASKMKLDQSGGAKQDTPKTPVKNQQETPTKPKTAPNSAPNTPKSESKKAPKSFQQQKQHQKEPEETKTKEQAKKLAKQQGSYKFENNPLLKRDKPELGNSSKLSKSGSFKQQGKWKKIEFQKREITDPSGIIQSLRSSVEVEQQQNKILYIGMLALQGNKLSDIALQMLIEFLIEYKDKIHIKIFYLFKNNIANEGMKWLGKYIREAEFLPTEIHLSHNMIDIEGATHLFKAIKERDYPKQPTNANSAKNAKGKVPLWVRLEFNLVNIPLLWELLEQLKLPKCLANDRQKCGPSFCQEPNTPPVHLYVIEFQYKPVDESMMLRKTKEAVSKRRAQKKAALTQSSTEPLALGEKSTLPLFIFLDTNAVLGMLSPDQNSQKTSTFAKSFTWKNILNKVKTEKFGYQCWEDDGERVCFMLTNTVMQEVDHQKKRIPLLRKQIVQELQSEEGFLAEAVKFGCLEMLGAHQGERLIADRGQEMISTSNLQNQNLFNDIMLINVALFWNHEIGETGHVLLLTNDRGCLQMAKDHHLPAGLLSELDQNLEKYCDQPWSASLLKQCIPAASTSADGKKLNAPVTFSSIYNVVQEAIEVTRDLLDEFRSESEFVFKWKYHGSHQQVVLRTAQNWDQDIPMIWTDTEGCWVAHLPLIPCTLEYKFIINGEWMYDIELPNMPDSNGNWNNVLVIPGTRFKDISEKSVAAESSILKWTNILKQQPQLVQQNKDKKEKS